MLFEIREICDVMESRGIPDFKKIWLYNQVSVCFVAIISQEIRSGNVYLGAPMDSVPEIVLFIPQF